VKLISIVFICVLSLLPFAVLASPRADLYQIAFEHLMDQAPWYQDKDRESPLEREDRMRKISQAQVEVSEEFTSTGKFSGTTEELLILLRTTSFWESRHAQHVHAGECDRKTECDRGTSKSIYQLKLLTTLTTREMWEKSEGLGYENTKIATVIAATYLSHSWSKCGGRKNILQVINNYGRGKCNTAFPSAEARKSYFEQELQDLSAMLRSEDS